jgi:hypothetical protein
MSAAQPPTSAPTAPATRARSYIRIVSHSNLVYWYPVWAVGFILGILSMFSGDYMVTVPEGTHAGYKADITGGKGKDTKTGSELVVEGKNREVLVLPEGKHLKRAIGSDDEPPTQPRLHTWPSKGFGVAFATVLLLVIIITNIPLRGMWSVMIIVVTIMLIIILSLAEAWPTIREWWSRLDIRINAGGYFFISTVLLFIWAITFYLFDRQIYIVFTPGQLKVCTEIGGGEEVYDTVGLTLKKQRSDFFRHRILGGIFGGAGDLIVNTSGARAAHIELPNVLSISRVVGMVEEMMKAKAVVTTK